MNTLQKLIVVFASVLAVTVQAQVVTGQYANGSYDTLGPEVLNVGNLNAHWNIPVLHKSGRGLPFVYDLNYDSSVWFPSTVSGTNTWTPVANWGWKGDTDAVTGYISYFAETSSSYVSGHLCKDTTFANWVYHDSFGTAHQFSGSTDTGQLGGGTNCPSGNHTFAELAADGSGFSINVTNNNQATISGVQGQQFKPPVMNRLGGVVTDTNGNQLSVDNSGHFTDTTGSVVLTVAGNLPSPKTLTYSDMSGTAQTVTVSYASYTVQTAFSCSGVTEYPATSTTLVDRVTLPDSSFYKFNYEPTPGYAGSVTGRVASVVLPTGGTVRYTYTGANGGITCADGTTAGLTRIIDSVSGSSSSTSTYVRSSAGASLSHTDKTDGFGNVTQYDFVQPSTDATALSGILFTTNTIS